MSTTIISKDYKFSYSQNYDFNTTFLQVSSGNAQIKAVSSKYGTGNPYMGMKRSIIAESISNFTVSSTSGTGDILKYVMNVDGEDRWWTGTAWGTSNGLYAQSNLGSIVDTNIPTLITARSRVDFKIYFHSYDGSSTPVLDNINLPYKMSLYCTPNDVKGVMINVETSTFHDEDIIAYIENADNFIDIYVSMQYDLPITNASALKVLRTFSMIIASFHMADYLAKKEEKKVSDLTSNTYKLIINQLTKIAESKMSLTGLANTGKYDITTIDYNATFNQGPVASWGTDPDLLENIADGEFD